MNHRASLMEAPLASDERRCEPGAKQFDAMPQTASEGLPLQENFSWMLLANVVRAGCQWGMLAVLAKMGTPEMVGQFVLALAYSTPVMALFMVQLRVVQATDTRREFRFGDYLALRLVTSAFSLLAILGICLVANYSRETELVLVAVGISASIDSISDIVHGLMQQRERMDRIAQSIIAKGLLSVIGMTVALLVTGQVFYGILAVAASRLLVLLFWDLPKAALTLRESSSSRRTGTGTDTQDSLLPIWRRHSLIRLARLSWPLGVVMMLIILATMTPRYYVEHYLGEYELGIFGAIGYLGLAGIMAVGALGESATARLAEYYASRKTAAFCRLLVRLSLFGAAIGVLGVAVSVVAGKPILTILYGPEYAEHSNVLVWTMVGAGISYVVWFVNHSVTAARHFRSQLVLHTLAIAATATACWWFVPRYGLVGAAISLTVTALVQLLGAGLVISHAVWTQAKRVAP